MPKLTVVIGSTRPGRAGLPIAEWFISRAKEHGFFEVAVADLAVIDLPFLDEPHHPRFHRYEHQHTKDWSAVVESTDVFVFVTPEYNHGMPAPLKNAIDFLNIEWKDKAVGFVSYGGVAGGNRALVQLHEVVTTLKMFPIVENVHIPFHAQYIDESRTFHPNEIMEEAADVMLNELARVDAALQTLRSDQ